MYVGQTAAVAVERSAFSHNTANDCTCMPCSSGRAAVPVLTLRNVPGVVQRLAGGGGCVISTGTLVLRDSNFTSNLGRAVGAGFVAKLAQATVDSCRFVSNHIVALASDQALSVVHVGAGGGGGLAFVAVASGSSVTNTSFVSNAASAVHCLSESILASASRGGNVLLIDTASVGIQQCTIASGMACYGGGVSIVAGGQA